MTDTNPRYPTALPDEVAKKLVDLARAHGYGIDALGLVWLTKDMQEPGTARVLYEANVQHSWNADDTKTLWGAMR